MAIDSATELLFHIGADAEDGTANIQRFRTLLGKDLSDLKGEFSDWAKSVFGDLSTVEGAMTAATAAAAAGVVALAAAAVESAHKYSEYVDQVERGSRVTGLSAENMSKLRFAAETTHVSYDALVTGLTRFAGTIVKANEGNAQAQAGFQRLGITQDQVKAGERDMMPLLELVADRFQHLGSRVLQTAEARELFSRGGSELVNMLAQGSAGMREMFKEAEKLGLVLSSKDVQANEEYKGSVHLLKAELEAMAVSIGREVLPKLTTFVAMIASLPEATKRAAQEMNTVSGTLKGAFTFGLSDIGTFFDKWGAATEEAVGRIESLAKRVAAMPGEGNGLADLMKPPKEKTTEAWAGLSDLLQRVQERTEDLTAATDPLMVQYERVADEVDKAKRKFEELRAAGKLSAEDAKNQAQALALMPVALAAMLAQVQTQIADKQKEAAEKAKEADEKTTADLVKRIADQGEKTLEQRDVDWNDEIARMMVAYAKEGQLTAAHVTLLADLRAAGLARMHREELNAFEEDLRALQGHMAQLVEAQITTTERLKLQYDIDLANLQHEENEKTKNLAQGDQQRIQYEQMYALVRDQITKKYGTDLQALKNSQGWQGVLGAGFAQSIKRDEDLWKEWASSTQRSHMMVRVSMESLHEMSQDLFSGMAQGMGSAIAQAIVYSRSIGDAMRAAAAAELESVAARAMVQAIYAAAIGFIDLAEGDYVGAAAAFEAAGLFAAVGGAAAVAGRFIAPSQSGAGGAAGGAGGPGGTAGVGQRGSQTAARQADQQGVGAPAAVSGPGVTVNIYGHVIGTSGAGELCGITLLVGYPGLAWSDFAVLQSYVIYQINPTDGYTSFNFLCRDLQLLEKSTIYVHPENGFSLEDDNPWYLCGTPAEIFQAVTLFALGLDPSQIDRATMMALDSPGENIFGPWRPFQFQLTKSFQAKQFLEQEIFKPAGLYQVVLPSGQLSLRSMRPPAAGAAPVFTFTEDNLTQFPQWSRQPIVNEAVWQFDADQGGNSGGYGNYETFIEATSVSLYGRGNQFSVQSAGLRTELGAFAFTEWVSGRLFKRFSGADGAIKGGAPLLSLRAMLMTLPVWVGDYVGLTHSKMPDITTGDLGVTNRIYEVIDRQPDYASGTMAYKLLDTGLTGVGAAYQWGAGSAKPLVIGTSGVY